MEERIGKLEWKHSFRTEWKREWKKKVEKGSKKKLGIGDRKERTKVSLVVSSSTTAWPPVLYFRGSRLRPFPRTSQEFRVAIKFGRKERGAAAVFRREGRLRRVVCRATTVAIGAK